MNRLEIDVFASGSKGNCYYIYDGDTALLIECGIPFNEIQRKLNFTLSDIKGVLVSHEHMDHAKAVRKLLERGVQVYGSDGTARALLIENNCFYSVVKSEAVFRIGSFFVKGFSVHHDAAQPLGFLLKSSVTDETLLFFTDTFYLDYTFSQCDYIIAECNFSEEILYKNLMAGYINEMLYHRIYKSHMSLEKLISFLEACDLTKLKKIWLAHISDGNSDQCFFKKEIQAITGVEVILT